MSFPFDKIVVPSTALLYLAYRNNNQTRGGLGQVCATGIPFHWAREISEISNRNFGLMLRPGIAFTICTNQFHLPKKRPRNSETSVNHFENGTQISVWSIPFGKTGSPFQMFLCSRQFSSRNDPKRSVPFTSQPDFPETF